MAASNRGSDGAENREHTLSVVDSMLTRQMVSTRGTVDRFIYHPGITHVGNDLFLLFFFLAAGPLCIG